MQRAGQVYANMVKTDFPARAEAIAELLAANPVGAGNVIPEIDMRLRISGGAPR